ncbi:MAG TPA: hypothetical protein DIT01_18770 [Lentisphaeria bacterium]|nr:hypothetical protein [Lentisphaeria bacterium]|tara:strand:+ start:343 stop:2316 length:1974 start_codon:yes stop_codon:yes gene_type:complete
MSLLAPLFLAGLAALAVPIILHLMHREVPRRVIFPTIRHILKGQQFQSGRRGLRDFWTLLARLAILALIVLLFTRPIWEKPKTAVSDAGKEIVLFYDLSASMNAVDFESFAVKKTREIIGAEPNANFAMLASSDHIIDRAGLGTPASEVLAKVKALRPGVVPGNHSSALSAIDGLFSEAPGVRRLIYLFTDLQQQDWAPSSLPRVSAQAELEIVNPHEKAPPNVAILDVYPEHFMRAQKRRIRATVQVRNYSLQPMQAKLSITAGTTSSIDVRLRGEYSEKHVIDLEDPATNEAVVEIASLEGYQLDNAWHIWIGPQPPTQVAVIFGEGPTRQKQIEALFLRSALTVNTPGLPATEVDVSGPDLLWSEDVNSYKAIFLLDAVQALGEVEMESLQTYLRDGGTVVYVAGRRSADNLAKLNHWGITENHFLGILGQSDQLSAYSLGYMARGSSVTRVFEEESSDLLLFPIYKLAKLEAAENATVLLGINEATPLLIQEDVGRGVCFTLAINLSHLWSEFPTSYSFLPLLDQIVQYQPGDEKKRGVLVADVGQDYTAIAAAASLEVTEILAEPGVHMIDGTPLELNYTRLESDPRTVESLEVYAQLLKSGSPGLTVAGKRPSSNLTDLRYAVAIALAAFLFIELLFANFRRSRKTAPAEE